MACLTIDFSNAYLGVFTLLLCFLLSGAKIRTYHKDILNTGFYVVNGANQLQFQS
jgi:hypothetical protein